MLVLAQETEQNKLYEAIIDHCIQLQTALRLGQQEEAISILQWLFPQVGQYWKAYGCIEGKVMGWYSDHVLRTFYWISPPDDRLPINQALTRTVIQLLAEQKAEDWFSQLKAYRQAPLNEREEILLRQRELQRKLCVELKAQQELAPQYRDLANVQIAETRSQIQATAMAINNLNEEIKKRKRHLSENLLIQLGKLLTELPEWLAPEPNNNIDKLQDYRHLAIWPKESTASTQPAERPTHWRGNREGPRASRSNAYA